MTQEEFNKYCKEHNVRIFDINYSKLTEKDMNAVLELVKDIKEKN